MTPAQQSPTKPFFDDKTKTDASFFGGEKTTGGAPFFNPVQLSTGLKPLGHSVTLQSQKKIQRGKTEDDIKAKLTERYKLAGVLEDGKVWTEEELIRLQDTLIALPEEDKAVLKDLSIVRVVAIGSSDSRTLGQFNTTKDNTASIKLANIAFDNKTKQETMATIAHEVGHAVASFKRKTAIATYNQSVTDEKQEFSKYETANNISKEARSFFLQKHAERKLLAEQYTALGDIQTPDTLKLLEEIETLDVAIAEARKLMNDSQANTDVRVNILKEARTTIAIQKDAALAETITSADAVAIRENANSKKVTFESALKQVPTIIDEKEQRHGANYSAAVDAVGAAILRFHAQTDEKKLTEEEIDPLIEVVKQWVEKRNQEEAKLKQAHSKNTTVGMYFNVVQAQNAYFEAAKVQALAHDRKAVVQKFINFVNNNKIDPNITPYALDSWPHKPEEFYAEAYSFFVTDKPRLIRHSKILFDWFEQGHYKS